MISAKRTCKSCHSPKTNFRKTKFNHGKETKFPLRGKHKKKRCKDCHKIGSGPEAPQMACVTCHEDVHKGRFGKETCEGCHQEQGWKGIIYAHNTKTKFELTGKHTTTKCTTCHRFGIALRFERFETTDCAKCHEHQAAHCGQFGMDNCERCHVRGGDRTSKFDHNLTRFPLERAHAKVDCDRCHRPERLGRSRQCRKAIKYTGLQPQCFACHVDIHKGELGEDCAKCHTGGENFKTLVFDHNKDSQFALTGFHQLVQCDGCHVGRKYKLGDIACYACHAKDDVHNAKLGNNCEKCHEPSGGARKFDHNLHTTFTQEGVHARIECSRCHVIKTDRSPGSSGVELDLEFRAAGRGCEACHPDPHQVREDLECEACHGFEKWTSPERNGYHESAGFQLAGAHTVVACSLCHSGSGSMLGKGERCGDCHRQDDVHAGSLGADCGRCHEQVGWLPTTFTHVDTGYVLEGLHRTLDCRRCHQAGNFFIGQECYQCHMEDYRRSIQEGGFHGITPPEDGRRVVSAISCGDCHNQFTFDEANGGPMNTPVFAAMLLVLVGEGPSRWSNRGAQRPTPAPVPVNEPLPKRVIRQAQTTPGQRLTGAKDRLSARLSLSFFHLQTEGQDLVIVPQARQGIVLEGEDRDVQLMRARASLAYDRIGGTPFGVPIRPVDELNLELGDRADGSAAALQELEVRVDVVFLGQVAALKDTGHRDTQLADRKPVTNLQVAPGRDSAADDRGILMLLELGPVAGQHLEVARRLQFRRRHSVENHHVETRAAIVGKHLNGHHVADAVQAGNPPIVILRQMARRRAEFMSLESDQRSASRLTVLELVDALLHRADQAKNEQRDGRAADGQHRPRTVSPQGLQRVRQESKHGYGRPRQVNRSTTGSRGKRPVQILRRPSALTGRGPDGTACRPPGRRQRRASP